MTDWQIIDAITDAFERSTKADNAFCHAIEGIDWKYEYEADGERYYTTASGLTLTTPSLDPFEITRDWPAEFMFADRSGSIDVFGRITRYA